MAGPTDKEDKSDQPVTSISRKEFISQRDSVVTGLTALIGAIGDLSQAYISHTNKLLSGGSSAAEGLDTLAISNFLSTTNGIGNQAGVAAAAAAAPKTRRKRVKKEKDPNAPKRPLTAFFLYSTSARPLIKQEMLEQADTVTPVAVNSEILRRWKEMNEEDKKEWKDMYEVNHERYKQEVANYKAQTGVDLIGADEEDTPDAEGEDVEIEDLHVGTPSSDDATSSSSDEDVVQKPPTPPAVKPKPKPTKRKAKDNGVAARAAITSPSAQLLQSKVAQTPAVIESEKRKKGIEQTSPEEPRKKKARKSKGGEEVVKKDVPEVAPPIVDKKEKKKKRKSEGF
ncbi:hypothetical protein EJ06DRAFT_525736 [Trichodelitschia bisporula]|uniref:HMG box domain-containing protein n=1 Tax=Trichodelitschia bisporula TaxID=703511 RepID=A0A6G1IAI0_9PEZI|nr:hypothetical protein EJ06DRAFT_525736 [Trichodelitschia bisporula]